MSFQLTSKYKPTGDQPEAIALLSQGVRDGLPHQTLLGVTGSGKTFTIANVIQQVWSLATTRRWPLSCTASSRRSSPTMR